MCWNTPRTQTQSGVNDRQGRWRGRRGVGLELGFHKSPFWQLRVSLLGCSWLWFFALTHWHPWFECGKCWVIHSDSLHCEIPCRIQKRFLPSGCSRIGIKGAGVGRLLQCGADSLQKKLPNVGNWKLWHQIHCVKWLCSPGSQSKLRRRLYSKCTPRNKG